MSSPKASSVPSKTYLGIESSSMPTTIKQATFSTDNMELFPRKRTNTTDTGKTNSSRMTQTFRTHVRSGTIGKQLGKIALKHDLVPTYTPNEEALYSIPEDKLHSRGSYAEIINAAIEHARQNIAKGERPVYVTPRSPRPDDTPVDVEPRHNSVVFDKGAWDMLDQELETNPLNARSTQARHYNANNEQVQRHPTALQPANKLARAPDYLGTGEKPKGATFHGYEHDDFEVRAVSRPKRESCRPLIDRAKNSDAAALFIQQHETTIHRRVPSQLKVGRRCPSSRDIREESPPISGGSLKQKLLEAQLMIKQLNRSTEDLHEGPNRSRSANKRRTTTILLGSEIDVDKANAQAIADAMHPSITITGSTPPPPPRMTHDIRKSTLLQFSTSFTAREPTGTKPTTLEQQTAEQYEFYDMKKHIKSLDTSLTVQQAYEQGLFSEGTMNKLDKYDWAKLAGKFGILETPASVAAREVRLNCGHEEGGKDRETGTREVRDQAPELRANAKTFHMEDSVHHLRRQPRCVPDTKLTAQAKTFHPDLPAHCVKIDPVTGQVPIHAASQAVPKFKPWSRPSTERHPELDELVDIWGRPLVFAPVQGDDFQSASMFGRSARRAPRQDYNLPKTSTQPDLTANAKTFHSNRPVHVVNSERPSGIFQAGTRMKTSSAAAIPSDLTINAKTFYPDQPAHCIRLKTADTIAQGSYKPYSTMRRPAATDNNRDMPPQLPPVKIEYTRREYIPNSYQSASTTSPPSVPPVAVRFPNDSVSTPSNAHVPSSQATNLDRTRSQYERDLNASRRVARDPANGGFRFIDREASASSPWTIHQTAFREKQREMKKRQDERRRKEEAGREPDGVAARLA